MKDLGKSGWYGGEEAVAKALSRDPVRGNCGGRHFLGC